MTFLDQLHSHVGCLVRLKTELYWYGSDSWDRVKERICLLLEVGDSLECPPPLGSPVLRNVDATVRIPHPDESIPCAATLLFIDGSPRMIWISKRDVELIQ